MLNKHYQPLASRARGQQPALLNHSTAITSIVGKGNQAPTTDEWAFALNVNSMCHTCLTLGLKVKGTTIFLCNLIYPMSFERKEGRQAKLQRTAKINNLIY